MRPFAFYRATPPDRGQRRSHRRTQAGRAGVHARSQYHRRRHHAARPDEARRDAAATLIDINALEHTPPAQIEFGAEGPASRRTGAHVGGRRPSGGAAAISGDRAGARSSPPARKSATWRRSAAMCCSAPAARISATLLRRLQQAQPGLRLRRAAGHQSHARGAGHQRQCIATYPGDFAQALIALDAQVEIAGPKGTRTMPFAKLHRPPGDTPHVETTLAPGELITAFRRAGGAVGPALAVPEDPGPPVLRVRAGLGGRRARSRRRHGARRRASRSAASPPCRGARTRRKRC